MPLFRRKSTDLVEDQVSEVETSEDVTTATRGHTPSKRELGVATPKRPSTQRRPGGAAVSRTPLTKEEAKEQRRLARQRESERFRREGGPRDRGPERVLVRNVVDSRRTVGSFFLGGAFVVLIGASVPDARVQAIANVLWLALALAVIVDSILISRRIKKVVRERFPKTTERMGSLYFYGISRSLSFRRMRVPMPAVAVGEKY
ncbi:DUF3043 domain-containing protein [Catenuloplanes atrovinosus]|uniref:DUF3043 domain-containing protein n=1 Tax=Catenuloplanes atrovinosus TaxID=137266 RepID=A0AAE3YQT6_9ACTN|nr:DUF3043 domain-containing protein [Catenuloplanes atrovinosus]MDR7278288.1 hypothetical protein [Catenuloplanes atrovinosus]